MYYFFNLLDRETLSNFADFKDQRKSLSCLSWIFILTFAVRGGFLVALGHYDWLGGFWKYEIYLLLTVGFEAPNLFFLYLTHLRSFGILGGQKKEDPQKSKAESATEVSYSCSQSQQSSTDSDASSEDLGQTNFTLAVIQFDSRFKSVYRNRASSLSKILDEDLEQEPDSFFDERKKLSF